MITLNRNKWLQNVVGLGGYEDENSHMKVRRIAAVSTLMGSTMLTCLINLCRLVSDVKVATELMFCAAIYVIVLCSYFTVIRNRDTIRGFFIDIQDRVDRRIAARRDNYYENVEQVVDKLTLWYFRGTLGGSFMYGGVPFLVVSVHLAMHSYSLDKWGLHYNNVWLPFELNSAKRFMFVNLLQSMSCWSGTTILITIISMYFGIILYIRAFLGDFKFFLDDMDMQAKDDDKAALSATMRALVNFHVEITEVCSKLADIMKVIILVTFTPCILSMCGSLLRGQTSTENFDWGTVYVACFSLVYITSILFLLCFFGNILTSNCGMVANTCYGSDWYNYPVRTQRYIAFMIRRAQEPFWVSAFGIMPCTLENFKAVMNTALSAYMVLRTL